MQELLAAEQLDADGELEKKFWRWLKNPPTKCANGTKLKASLNNAGFDTDVDDDNFVTLSDSTSGELDMVSDIWLVDVLPTKSAPKKRHSNKHK